VVVDAEAMLIRGGPKPRTRSEYPDEHFVTHTVVYNLLRGLDRDLGEGSDDEHHSHTGRVRLVRSELVEDVGVRLPTVTLKPHL